MPSLPGHLDRIKVAESLYRQTCLAVAADHEHPPSPIRRARRPLRCLGAECVLSGASTVACTSVAAAPAETRGPLLHCDHERADDCGSH